MIKERCRGVFGEGGGKEANTSYNVMSYCLNGRRKKCGERTKGGVRYSRPILLALRVFEITSFIKLYLSIRKLRVGPSDNLTIRREGAMDVKVKARM
jgi:hypothetical protein